MSSARVVCCIWLPTSHTNFSIQANSVVLDQTVPSLIWVHIVCYRDILKGTTPDHIAQSVTCLTTDARLTADPGVASLIPAGSHTCLEIDREIISTGILMPSTDSFKKVCCKLQAKVCARSTGSSLPREKCA